MKKLLSSLLIVFVTIFVAPARADEVSCKNLFDKNNVVFVPYDIRFGWQPHFSEKDKGWCFKMETGLMGFGTKGGADFIPLAIGATYKF